MRLHRFYIKEMHNRFGEVSLGEFLWVKDERLLNQWLKVLRYKVDSQVIIFNDIEERLYKIIEIAPDAIKLVMITQLEQKIPDKKLYLFWSILKKDKNDWVLQKATELGVHKFVPLIAERSEKTSFNIERASKIVIEASEQCGRSDIPLLREPIAVNEAVEEYSAKITVIICEQNSAQEQTVGQLDTRGLMVGPEGGWSDQEKQVFRVNKLPHISISKFTLRAETASIVGVAKIMDE